MIKDLLQILDNKEKTYLFFLFFIMLISVALEMISIGLILPVLNIIFQNDYILKIKEYLPFLNDYNFTELVIGCLVIVILTYLVKTFILLFFQIKTAKFATEIGRNISKKLYKNYVFQDYEFYLNIDSSKIIRNTINETSNIFSFIFHIFSFLIELLVFLGILLILLYFNPKETIILSIMILSISLIYIILNKTKISKISEARIKNDGKRIKTLQQMLDAIKEVKLYNKYQYFINIYSNANQVSFNSIKTLRILQAIPRLLLEFFVVIFISTLIFALYLRGLSFIEMIPVLGLFFAALIRILPSSARMITSFQGFTYGFPSLKIVSNELQNFDQSKKILEDNPKKIDFNKLIYLNNLSFKFPGSNQNIINNMNLKIEKNTLLGVIGRSGSGKSTLINLILGFLKPTSGSIQVDNMNIFDEISAWQSKISYVPQNVMLLDDTILNNIAFGITTDIDMKKINDCLKMAELNDFVHSKKENLNSLVGEKGVKISGGQVQRIGIARALYRNPSLLILDEATSSLDKKTEESIFNTIHQLKKNITIIVITHNTSNLKNFDQIINLEEYN